MTRALLDVNVLVALLEADHVDHLRARAWFELEAQAGWASCAITQNGYVRVVSQSAFPNPSTPAMAMARLARAAGTELHEFWPCDRSLLDERLVERSRVHGASQLTDIYLLSLAVSRQGRFVTLDRRIPLSAVVGARETHLVVI